MAEHEDVDAALLSWPRAATVASIANVDSWLRHVGLGKADARRVREAYGDDAARVVRENPYRLADEVHGTVHSPSGVGVPGLGLSNLRRLAVFAVVPVVRLPNLR